MSCSAVSALRSIARVSTAGRVGCFPKIIPNQAVGPQRYADIGYGETIADFEFSHDGAGDCRPDLTISYPRLRLFDTLDRANLRALRAALLVFTFVACIGIDFVWTRFRNRLGGTFGQAQTAFRAFVGDFHCHVQAPSVPKMLI